MRENELLEHMGCKLEVASYGDKQGNLSVTVECLTHGVVLFEADPELDIVASDVDKAEQIAIEIIDLGMGELTTVKSLVFWLLEMGITEGEIANSYGLSEIAPDPQRIKQ